MRHTALNRRLMVLVLAVLLLFSAEGTLRAWSEHTLIGSPVLGTMPEVKDAATVPVETLDAFLNAEAAGLEKILAEEEAWDKANLAWYLPRPDALAFKAEGPDIRERFCHAIRINPKVDLVPYLQLLPGEDPQGRPVIPIKDLTFLQDISSWDKSVMVALKPGESAAALAVLNTATDEPDFGLDINLFTDNKTELGPLYGFGRQPYGNPNLEFGSQAPFHMGFYHEDAIMYRLAAFLKESYPEYRIHLYKRLAEYAFATGHPYWGWRFTGWGLHYLADLAQPYHATVLPGVSTTRALWINTIAMLGIHGPKDNAIQLVSNRHLVLEKFLQIELYQAYRDKQTDDPILAALRMSDPDAPYDDRVARDKIAQAAHAKAALTDKIIAQCMPKQYVSDPHFEFGTCPDQDQLVDKIRAEKGDEAIAKLRSLNGDLLLPFRQYGRSYVRAILNESGAKK